MGDQKLTLILFFQLDLVEAAAVLLLCCGAAVQVFELVEDREDGRLEAVDVVQEAGRVLLLRGPAAAEGHS